MTADDLPEITRLEAEIFSDPWPGDFFEDSLDRPYLFTDVAEDENGVIAGYIQYSVILEDCEIRNLAVVPSRRQEGLGTLLLKSALSRAESLGATLVCLEVRASNLPARNLYEKNGFLPVQTRKNYYSSPREDAVVMGRLLTKDTV